MVPGLGAACREDRIGRHTIRRHGASLSQNSLVLHDLNARNEYAEESIPLWEDAFAQELPDVGHVPLDLPMLVGKEQEVNRQN